MTQPAISKLGFLGTGGMGGSQYAAFSTLMSMDNEISIMNQKARAESAKVLAEITKERQSTQIESANQTKESAIEAADKEFTAFGTDLVSCLAGFGLSFKDFSKKTLDSQIKDTKSFQDELNKPSESIVDDSESLQVRTEKTKLINDYCAKENALIERFKNTDNPTEIQKIEEESDLLATTHTAERKLLNDRETEILNKPPRYTDAEETDLAIEEAPRTTEQQKVIDQWIGNDTRAPNVRGFKGNEAIVKLLKNKPDELLAVTKTVNERMEDLEREKNSIDSQGWQSSVQITNNGTNAVNQGAGGVFDLKRAALDNTAAIENAEVESIKMAQEAFQAAVSSSEQAAQAARDAAIQAAQGYQQAVRN